MAAIWALFLIPLLYTISYHSLTLHSHQSLDDYYVGDYCPTIIKAESTSERNGVSLESFSFNAFHFECINKKQLNEAMSLGFSSIEPNVLSFYNSFEPMFILMNSPIFHIKATLQTKWLICVLINFMNIENDLVDIDVAEVVCCLLLLLCSSFNESSPCKSVQKIHPRMNRQRLKTQSIYIDSVVMICGQWNFRIICCFGNERCKY